MWDTYHRIVEKLLDIKDGKPSYYRYYFPRRLLCNDWEFHLIRYPVWSGDDYEGLLPRAIDTTIASTAFGIPLSFLTYMHVQQYRKFSKIAARSHAFKMLGRYALFGLLYGSTVYAVAHARGQKDDIFNHFIAGFMSSLIFSPCFKKDARLLKAGLLGLIIGSSAAGLKSHKYKSLLQQRCPLVAGNPIHYKVGYFGYGTLEDERRRNDKLAEALVEYQKELNEQFLRENPGYLDKVKKTTNGKLE